MVVEDDDTLRNMYTDVLRSAGWTVVANVASGRAAVDFVESGNAVDVVLMDYRLPVLDGRMAMKEIKAINPSIKVVFATGDKHLKDFILDEGAEAIILKPFDMDRMIDIINKVGTIPPNTAQRI